MANEYSKISLINIYKDEVFKSTGQYTRTNNKFTLGSNSSVTFKREWTDPSTALKTDSLRLLSLFSNRRGEGSRYKNNIYVKIKIRYYVEDNTSGNSTSMKPGHSVIYVHSPYNTNDTDGLTKDYLLEINDSPIHSLECNIYNSIPIWKGDVLYILHSRLWIGLSLISNR